MAKAESAEPESKKIQRTKWEWPPFVQGLLVGIIAIRLFALREEIYDFITNFRVGELDVAPNLTTTTPPPDPEINQVPTTNTQPAAPEQPAPALAQTPAATAPAEATPALVEAAPKAVFVSDDTYATAELNMHSLGADPVVIDEPSQEDIWDLQEAAYTETVDRGSVTLSSLEAELALLSGGFVKDGVTYEVWEVRGEPGNFHIVKCDADHRLVGEVPNFDTMEKPPEPNYPPDEATTEYGDDAFAEEMEERRRVKLAREHALDDRIAESYDLPPRHDEDGCEIGRIDEPEIIRDPYIDSLRRQFPPHLDPSFFLLDNPYYPYGPSEAFTEIQKAVRAGYTW